MKLSETETNVPLTTRHPSLVDLSNMQERKRMKTLVFSHHPLHIWANELVSIDCPDLEFSWKLEASQQAPGLSYPV